MPAPWARVAQLRIVGELHGQQTVNVLHVATNTVVQDGGPLDELLLQAVTAIRDCVMETLLPATTSEWKFVGCDGRIIHPAEGNTLQASALGVATGALSNCSHSITSALVRISTGGGGRSGKGRWFLPPPGENEIAQSTIDAPTLVLIAAFLACVASKFMGANKTTDWTLGVLSRRVLQATNSHDQAFREASSLNPVAQCSYKSSRQRGRGI